jgi:hypothetical protein
MRGRRRSVSLHRVAGEEFAKDWEVRRPVVSGIEVDSVVEVLVFSWSKVVVVARSKQKLARSQHAEHAKMPGASLKISRLNIFWDLDHITTTSRSCIQGSSLLRS